MNLKNLKNLYIKKEKNNYKTSEKKKTTVRNRKNEVWIKEKKKKRREENEEEEEEEHFLFSFCFFSKKRTCWLRSNCHTLALKFDWQQSTRPRHQARSVAANETVL